MLKNQLFAGISARSTCKFEHKSMETHILIAILILILQAIILIAVMRNPLGKELPQIQSKVLELQITLAKIESSLKEDFRITRLENTTIAQDNRRELNNSLKEIKTELSETLKTITGQNQQSLNDINKTLAEKIEFLNGKIESNNRANRDDQAKNLKDFTFELRTKFDELKREQKDLTIKTTELTEKITNKVEERLRALDAQSKVDNKMMRDDLTTSIKGFRETMELKQNELLKNSETKLDSIRSAVENKLYALNEQSKVDHKQMRDELTLSFKSFREAMEAKQNELVKNTETKLDSIRAAVEEKLEKTLSERLGQSFETVGKQLIEVQKGLGEMQTMAADVGGLKKVLSNVKLRGGIGEVQLAMLLEQILAPNQYETNFITVEGSTERVEFAIKLPGRNEDESSIVYLPIDAKFPKDSYEHLISAYENAIPDDIESASKNLESTIRKMAKDIRDKYLGPNTTDFAIMFLPFESIYAEVIRRSSLVDQLRNEYKITVAGPTTLLAILNSLQMGFRAMALQKRSSEVWRVLAKVKAEFDQFGGLLDKAQKNIQSGLHHLETVAGARTRAIKRQLNNLESMPAENTQLIDAVASDAEIIEDKSENPEQLHIEF